MAADLERPDSRIHQRLVAGAGGLGAFLAEHELLRAAINEHLEQGVRRLAEPLRDGAARHIADTIHAWRDEDLVRQIEWSVGTDLQYIRINGSLVGGRLDWVSTPQCWPRPFYARLDDGDAFSL